MGQVRRTHVAGDPDQLDVSVPAFAVQVRSKEAAPPESCQPAGQLYTARSPVTPVDGAPPAVTIDGDGPVPEGERTEGAATPHDAGSQVVGDGSPDQPDRPHVRDAEPTTRYPEGQLTAYAAAKNGRPPPDTAPDVRDHDPPLPGEGSTGQVTRSQLRAGLPQTPVALPTAALQVT